MSVISSVYKKKLRPLLYFSRIPFDYNDIFIIIDNRKIKMSS